MTTFKMRYAYAERTGRDEAEARRLDEQFDLLTRNIGYLLHPIVSASLPSNPCIADIGTGTGIFLRALYPSVPDAQLDGYDISAALYPSASTLPSTLPPNNTLSLLDARKPIPEPMRGVYDVVHVRLIATDIPPEEWSAVVRNVSLLVKPGGYLQWEECDIAGLKYLRGRDGSRVEKTRVMGAAFLEGMRERFAHGWNTMSEDMRAAGLVDVDTEVISSDRLPETRERMTVNSKQDIFAWARLVAKQGLPVPFTAAQLERTEKEVSEEIASGCYVRFDIHVAFGRKPAE
ncbi:S-adenosyl-L-methionine-dependent methyltransferase [Camillea tinctor]|nr:S-adenosyl-L-methionine-dependent methyltransferase [Camillea tinctor]